MALFAELRLAVEKYWDGTVGNHQSDELVLAPRRRTAFQKS